MYYDCPWLYHLNSVEYYKKKNNNSFKNTLFLEEERNYPEDPCEAEYTEDTDIDEQIRFPPVLVLHGLYDGGDVVDADHSQDVEHAVREDNEEHG